MAVTLKFFAGGYQVNTAAGSGLGFFGSSFGTSVAVGSWQARSFICSSDGVSQGPEVDNCMWVATTGVIPGAVGNGILLRQLPNDQATLNIRLESDTAISVPTATIQVYDRVSQNNSPSGITFRLFEAIHPDPTANLTGSGDTTWTDVYGSGSTFSLAVTPGSGGLTAGNGTTGGVAGKQMDWFVGISCQPASVGSKTAALLCTVEYL